MLMAVVFFLTYLIILYSSVRGLVPRACVSNVTSVSKECCPIPAGFKEPCGGYGRGYCRKFEVMLRACVIVYIRTSLQLELPWPSGYELRLSLERLRVLILVKVIGG